RAIDQVQTVARFCRESIENTLPHPSPRPAVEPIVRTRVRAIAFGQIAPRDPGPQHVKYCIYDPSIVRARALPTVRHQRLNNRPFLIVEIVFVVATGEANACGRGCSEWIASEGQFDEGAAQRFREFLAVLAKRDLPVFFNSDGGLVSQAVQ